MLKQLKNIDTAFKHIRAFSIMLIISCAALTAFTIYKSYELITETQSKVYILANGKAMEAFASDRTDNIAVEARDHVKMFHYFFFTLHPDDKVIQTNLNKALYLADQSAKAQYDNLRENSYYANIISGNVSQEILIDSVRVDTQTYPYYFRFSAKQKIIRTTSIVTRTLITEGLLRNVQRSDNNPHGLLIERWSTIENKDIKVENR
jgi:conjugative transposon TraK protein